MAGLVDKLVAELTLEEKAGLTAGEDAWSTRAVPRLGIPKVRVTDGPNGARGATAPGAGGSRSVCVPCGSALGATWDPELVGRIGAVLGEETRAKACRVLLAPTVNIHRSPLAGRNFECYSEDPFLSGKVAAGFVRGVQSQGVATTVKHFAGNDAEFERSTISSEIDDRTLREIYLLPFELAVREGGALGIMTGYNRLNGTWCAEHAELLDRILRREWGFEGFVVTDWYGIGSTTGSAEAGLDLEMPGPGRIYGEALRAAVAAGQVEPALLDGAVRRLLNVFDRLGVFDDPGPDEETPLERPEHRAVAREAAAASMVLLRNAGALPLAPGLRRVAVLGPNAARAQIMGGGSAHVSAHYRITPLEAIQAALGDSVDVRHEPGCVIDRSAPPLATPLLAGPGLELEWFTGGDLDGDVMARTTRPDSRIQIFARPEGLPRGEYSFRAAGTLHPPATGTYTFTLVQAGQARLFVDGDLLIDGMTEAPGPGEEFFGSGSAEMEAAVDLEAGRPVPIVIEYSSRQTRGVRAVRVGCRVPVPADLFDRAVEAAAAADVAIVVVGTTDEWESEGHDRATMDLPGRQDELVRAVAAANPNTVVVVNTGAPVAMDWAEDVNAILHVWFGGQEMATALADVLRGAAEPGGRLPTTFPVRLEHNPSFGNFPGENGKVRYGEGVFVGYRWYQARHLPTRFPFGHGLSYSTFAIGEPRVSPGDVVEVEVPVTNTGTRPGSEVVQCYVAPPATTRLVRPPRELKAFAKISLAAGETGTVTLRLDERAFSYWDPGDPEWTDRQRRLASIQPVSPAPSGRVDGPGWRCDPGVYELHIGRSSADIAHVVPVTVP